MPSLSSASLALAVLAAGHLALRCTTSPNPPQDSSKPNSQSSATDRIWFLTETIPRLVQHAIRLVFFYHAALILFATPDDDKNEILLRICPHPSHLNGNLFGWSPTTVAALLSIALGGFIRIFAYNTLGKNFTFALSAPDRMVTEGFYSIMQHPSYTGLFFAGAGAITLACRWDAAPGCVMHDGSLDILRGWGPIVITLWTTIFMGFVTVRVRDEEHMMHKQFGTQWEEWHRRTARFVPGIF